MSASNERIRVEDESESVLEGTLQKWKVARFRKVQIEYKIVLTTKEKRIVF